jgi:nucleotide-binding universal stress UspA family protein/CheY-like chemotaxis protein
MYRSILVPITQSKHEEAAVETAARMAKAFGGKIILIQALEIIPLLPTARKEEYKSLKEQSDNYLAPIRKNLESQNITTELVVKTGIPDLVISKYAEENDVDIVIMAVSNTDKSFQGIKANYVAERLFKHSNKPVLIVKSDAKDILSGRQILIVDDEPDILDTIEEELRMCTVQKAGDYDTAMVYIGKNSYDIVLLDIMGVDGFSILEETVKRGIPTVMLTAHALSKEALNKAAKLGAASFLPKEKMMELDTFLVDVIKNAGRPVWKKLFERMSSYYQEKIAWNAEDEQEFVSKFSKY